jgi:hypothetical protein
MRLYSLLSVAGALKEYAPMKRYRLQLMSCLVLAVMLAGCAEPSASSLAGSSTAVSGAAESSSPPSVVEGRITSPIAVEEGFLRLDLSDGTRMEFMTDESVVSMDSLLSAAGKRCRVYYKDSFYEDVEGDRSPALQMTRVQWL